MKKAEVLKVHETSEDEDLNDFSLVYYGNQATSPYTIYIQKHTYTL